MSMTKAITLNRTGAKKASANFKAVILGTLEALVLKAIHRTLKLEIVHEVPETEGWSEKAPMILSFWHGHQTVIPLTYLAGHKKKRRPIFALISEHGDGRIAAVAMRRLGISSVAGSSTRGGKEAADTLIKVLNDGGHIGITLDGPKGPIYKAKAGAVRISQRTGAGILPAAAYAEHAWRFKSWDEMFLPKPFSRVRITVGAPIFVPSELKEGEFESYLEKVETTLNELTRRSEF